MASESRSGGPSSASSGVDRLYWLIAISLVAGGIYGNWYFQDTSLLVRVLVLLVLAVVAVLVFIQTVRGRALLELARDARAELRRVIWPTRNETVQTTMIVLAVVLVVALILWALDSLLSFGISSVLG